MPDARQGQEPQAHPSGPSGPRFPALQRLGARHRKRRIPYVAQLEVAECGAACLAMVLSHLGKDVPLSEIRERTGTSRDGVNALGLVEAARSYGLRAHGVKLEEVDDLGVLPAGSILHLGFNHFVVFEGLHWKGVRVIDPAMGRRTIPEPEMRKQLTGVAMVFEPGEDFLPESHPSSRLWPFLAQALRGSRLVSRVLVTSAFLQILTLFLPAVMLLVVDRIVPQGDYQLLLVLGAGLIVIVVFFFLSSLIRAHLLLHLRTLVDVRLTMSFLEHLLGLPYAFYQKRTAGDLLLRLNSNSTIREILTSGLVSGVLDGVLVLIYLLILLWNSWRMALLVSLLAVVQLALFLGSRNRYRELMAQELEAQALAQGYEVQMLAGMESLKSSGIEDRVAERWSHLFVDVLNVVLSRGRLAALVESLLAALRLASPLLILWLGAYQVLLGRMSLGPMLAVSALASALLVPFSSLLGTALQFSLVRSYLHRIEDVLCSPREQEGAAASPAPPLSGQITLDHVSFRYGPSSPLAVDDVSVEVRPGQQIGIVGRSGSGKSTLARLLCGLYEPSPGRILYDGLDFARLQYRSVRVQMGLVPQDPALFATTIRDNIARADPTVDLDRILAAARRAQIHEEITSLPLGYDTPLPDGGRSLSGGQRQRIALARALVHTPRILVLDEATSDLDSITEQAIQRELASLGATVVLIAHRLSTISRADLILVMEAGRIVERGTHSQLLASGGLYADLIAAQATAPFASGDILPGGRRD